jgi:hypothetical protein
MKILAAISVLIALSVPALAQENRNAFRRNEISYNILSYSRQGSFDLWGGDLSFNHYISDRFSIVGELALHDNKSSGSDVVRTTTEYRIGPRYVLLQQKHTRVFGEFLVGGSRVTDNLFNRFILGISTTAKESANGYSFAAGGGIDVPIKPWITVRAAEVNYNLMEISGDTVNGIRVASGFVFRFGH